MKEKGQVILILILVMTVALAIGLSIVQKSLVDISNSSRIEESSRAFSAAEAGIEKALKGDTTSQTFSQNDARIDQIYDSGLTPYVITGQTQDPLEYTDLAKEDIAQIWLSDPTANLPACTGGSTNICYTQGTLDVYWGDKSASDKAALELTLIYYDNISTSYQFRKWNLDNSSASRNPANGFCQVSCSANYPAPFDSYACKKTLGNNACPNVNTNVNDTPLPAQQMLLRARLLYNTTSQSLAVQAVGTCLAGCSLPPQARKVYSVGVAGKSQRGIQLFQIDKVVPQYFDYAIFSAGDINK